MTIDAAVSGFHDFAVYCLFTFMKSGKFQNLKLIWFKNYRNKVYFEHRLPKSTIYTIQKYYTALRVP